MMRDGSKFIEPGPLIIRRAIFFPRIKGGGDNFSKKIEGWTHFFQTHFSQNPVSEYRKIFHRTLFELSEYIVCILRESIYIRKVKTVLCFLKH